MATQPGEAAPGYLRVRGVFWRAAALLLAVQAAACAVAAGVAYLVAGPALARDYFSAHQTVKATWELLVPALAAGAAAGLLVGGLLGVLLVGRLSRRLRAVTGEVAGVLRAAGEGRLPAPPPEGVGRRGPAEEAAASLEPLRAHVQELRRLARELQHPVLELTYRAAGTADVPPRDLRALAGALEQTSRDLAQALAWFED
jgi:hypothetical protein